MLDIKVEWDGLYETFANVSQYLEIDGCTPGPVLVNWYSMGAKRPNFAMAASAALVRAANVAKLLEGVKDWGMITPPQPGMEWRAIGMPEIFIRKGVAVVAKEGWATAAEVKKQMESK